MDAGELYRAGRLDEAIAAQVEQVKAHPADQARRLFLFELLGFAGDLDRAARQIDAIQYDDAELAAATAMYRGLIESERARRRLFAEGLAPGFLGEPPEHLRLRVEAVQRLREGRAAESAELIARAEESIPPRPGTLNGTPFQSLRDADDLFGHVLEVMAHGRYFWVALDQVKSLTMAPPRFPRDLLYAPAFLELPGERGQVFLPALYPRTHEHPDDQVRLGRSTDWTGGEGGPVLGSGQHTFVRDDDPIGLLEWRELQFEAEDA